MLSLDSAVGAEEVGRKACRNEQLLTTVPIEVSTVSDSRKT